MVILAAGNFKSSLWRQYLTLRKGIGLWLF